VEWNQICDQWDVKLSTEDTTSQADDGVLLVSISCGRAVSLWDWPESHFPRCVRFLRLQIKAWLNTWTPKGRGIKAYPPLDFWKSQNWTISSGKNYLPTFLWYDKDRIET
jgi:hypothetical protein